MAALAAGTHVVVDRYAHSGVAFSTAKPGVGHAWACAPDEGLPAPDVLLFLELPPAAAAGRGGFGGERYETTAFQTAVRGRFAALAAECEAAKPGLWRTVDADGTIDEVGDAIWGLLGPQLATGGEGPVRRLWDFAPLEA